MAWFWIGAAGLAAGAALLVMVFARRAVGAVGGENPALAVHRRQLGEIDDLAERGLLGEGDKAAARAEAGRRLLSAAALKTPPERAGTRASRLTAIGAAIGAGALALGLYLWIGAPNVPDQPYRARVAAWRRSDPAALDAPRMAAVLKALTAEHPADPQVWSFLGKADMGAGDVFGAETAFAHAVRLAPGRAEYQIELGEAKLAAAGDPLSPEDAADIEAVFHRALALDPQNIAGRYALGETQIRSGDRAGGIAMWRGIAAEFPPGDRRRPRLNAQIESIAAGGSIQAPPGPEPAASGGQDASAFIRGMVASLAAKLAAHPDDPAGWARLVRSYGVLHDAPAQTAALAEARKRFAGRPDALAPIEAEAKGAPAAQPH